tara:strand:+ start:276 stop:524 length:249 start_codon:yes stop_codon:yes gene_type:complete
MTGAITFLSRASATLNISFNSPSLVAMHAASLMKMDLPRRCGSVMRWKINPKEVALTSTPTIVCTNSNAVPTRHPLTIPRVP